MKSFLLFLTFSMTVIVPTFAQSAWDISYTEVKDISDKLEGRTCKPDFYPLGDRKHAKSHTYRYNLSRKDTVHLSVDGTDVTFVEVRPIYADWGLYREQYLQAVSPDENGLVMRIYDFKLVEVKGCRIDVETELQYFPAKAPRKKAALPIRKTPLSFRLKKRDLQGLMFEQ